MRLEGRARAKKSLRALLCSGCVSVNEISRSARRGRRWYLNLGPMTNSDQSTGCITRFAPSPTGHLHIGGARTALLCWAYAKKMGGKFVLRIEDTDQTRSSESSMRGILEDLAWLGIEWDEGPELEIDGKMLGGDPRGVGPFFQAQRLDLYNEAINRLIEEDKAYPAFETPEELESKRKVAIAAKIGYKYDRAALDVPREERMARLAAGEAHVVRLKMPDKAITVHDQILGDVTVGPDEFDDFIIRKRDGFPTYHLAVTVDDATMGVTHVLRGQEHLINTPRHIAIQMALGYGTPVYGHLPLIFNPDGSKMSKRDKDKTLKTVLKKDLADAAINDLGSRSKINDLLIRPIGAHSDPNDPYLRLIGTHLTRQVQNVHDIESLRNSLNSIEDFDITIIPIQVRHVHKPSEWLERTTIWMLKRIEGIGDQRFREMIEDRKQGVVGWINSKKTQAENDDLVMWANWFGVHLPEIDVEDFRRAGYIPEAINNYLSLLGWNPKTKNEDGTDLEHFDMDYLASHFDFAGVGGSASKFDRVKLMSFNGDATAALSDEEFASIWFAWAQKYDVELAEKFDAAAMLTLAPAVKTRCKTLADGRSVVGFALIADDEIEYDGKAVHKALIKGEKKGLELLKGFRAVVEGMADFSPESIESAVKEYAELQEVGMGKLAQPLRVAVTGAGVSPPLGQTLAILGKASVVARIDLCRAFVDER